jgi:hypothetical protein
MRRNPTGIDRQDVEALNALGAGGGPATPTIHLTLQGKGGVGKSLVSSILAQYFRPRGARASRISSRTSERCEAFSWRSPSRRSVVSVSQLRFYRDCTRSRWQLFLHDAPAGQPAALPWRRKEKTVSSQTSTLIDINELSKRLSIPNGTIYNWVYLHRIPVKAGSSLRFDPEEAIWSMPHYTKSEEAGLRDND